MSAHQHLSPRQFIQRGVSEAVGDVNEQMGNEWRDGGAGKVSAITAAPMVYPGAVISGVAKGVGEAIRSRRSTGFDPRYEK